MILSDYDYKIYSNYVISGLGKFQYTFTQKFPILSGEKINFEDLFRIYFLYDSKFNLYFFIDVVSYLYGNGIRYDTLVALTKYAATTLLPQKNAIVFRYKNEWEVFFREDDKVIYLGFDEFEKMEVYLKNAYKVNYICRGLSNE